jgi:GT2 family glycosyltransferase
VKITAVVPWWNHRELETDFWAAMRCADVEVLVIDNGSEPRLPNGWRLPENVGFSRACNIGLELAQTDAVLFLNNDVVAVDRDWVEPIRGALEPGVLVGASLRRHPHGDVNGVPFPYLDGWCLVGMTEDLRELGGFDESLEEPAYFSDNLLCLEARAAGMVLREVRVGLRHLENRTAGPASKPDVVAASAANRKVFENRVYQLMSVAA